MANTVDNYIEPISSLSPPPPPPPQVPRARAHPPPGPSKEMLLCCRWLSFQTGARNSAKMESVHQYHDICLFVDRFYMALFSALEHSLLLHVISYTMCQ